MKNKGGRRLRSDTLGMSPFLSIKRVDLGGIFRSSYEFVMCGGCREKRWPDGGPIRVFLYLVRAC